MSQDTITPNPDPASLRGTTTQGSQLTQPAAVITSDLATNATDRNLSDLKLEEQRMAQRRLEDRAIELEKQKAESNLKPKDTAPVDKEINKVLGVNEPAPDPVKVEQEKKTKSIRMQIENLSRDVDPYTAGVLRDIEATYLSSLT